MSGIFIFDKVKNNNDGEINYFKCKTKNFNVLQPSFIQKYLRVRLDGIRCDLFNLFFILRYSIIIISNIITTVIFT